jgi:hypothetical protein
MYIYIYIYIMTIRAGRLESWHVYAGTELFFLFYLSFPQLLVSQSWALNYIQTKGRMFVVFWHMAPCPSIHIWRYSPVWALASLRRRLPPFFPVYCSSPPSFVPRIFDVSFRTTSSQFVIGFLWLRVISYTFTDCWCNLLCPSSACLCKPTETYCVVQNE